MPESKAVLRVQGEGEFGVAEVVAFLGDLNHAYNSLLGFEIILDGLSRSDAHFLYPFPTPLPLFLGSTAYFVPRGRRGGGLRLAGEWPPAPERLASLLPLSEQLVLDAVAIASPGMWEFLGSLNPLETLRRYLNDRNERRKDRAWRDSADERRARLENARLEMDVIRDGVALARELGATDRDLAPLINELINKPLLALDKHQDQGLISSADIGYEDGPKKPR